MAAVIGAAVSARRAVTSAGRASTPERLPEVDLLRFIAAAAVVAYHYTFRPLVAGVGDRTVFAPLSGVTQFGYLGVDLFFLISGFVILWTAQGRQPRQFVASRLLRLFPSFWAALIVSLAFIAWLAPPVPRPWVLLANLTMLPGYAHVEPVSQVYWSLALEIKFYFYVWLLLLTRQLGRVETWLTVWLAAATVCQWHPGSALLRSLVIYPYGPLFIAGCLLFLIYRSGWTRGRALRVGWALLLACVATAHDAPGFMPGASRLEQLVAASGVVGCFALMAAVASRRLRIGAPALLIWLGSLTYPLYLVHDRVGRLTWSAMEGRLPAAARLILIVLLAGLFSWLIAELIERRLMSRLKRTVLVRRALTAA
jgi:peptidoglycan/LPS O-acetylase OafA/YrhL